MWQFAMHRCDRQSGWDHEHRGRHQQPRRVTGRQADRVRRHAAWQTDPLVQPADLWISSTTPGSTPKNLTVSYDYDISGGIGGDQSAPRGGNRQPIVWSKDQSSLIVASAEKGNANLKRVSIATGKVDPVTDGAQGVEGYSATPDASKIAEHSSTGRFRR